MNKYFLATDRKILEYIGETLNHDAEKVLWKESFIRIIRIDGNEGSMYKNSSSIYDVRTHLDKFKRAFFLTIIGDKVISSKYYLQEMTREEAMAYVESMKE